MTPEQKPGLAGRVSPPVRPGADSKITELTLANRHLKRKLFDLYTLFEISRNLSSLLETEQLLDHLLLTTIGQMGVGAASAVVDRTAEDPHLSLWRAKGITPPADFTVRLEKEGTFLKRLQMARMPLSRNTLEKAGDLDPAERRILRTFEAAMVCPMLVKEQIRGVLIVSRRLSGSEFTENDKEFLSILTSHFTVSVDNARLYESERNAHRRLKEAQSQLIHSEKLAAMGRLSATIAHEVNNPLGIIKNYLHLMKSQTDEGQTLHESLGVVSEEVNRIAEIVRRLLDFHRPASPGVHDLDLWRVIEDCLKLLRQARDNRKVIVGLPAERPVLPVRANGEELKQVFLNLFMNALDAMPKGGELSLRALRRRRTILVQVADSGVGIAREHLPRLFEPFFTTKEQEQGTGLGLYVCYGIIRRHGGRITARNRPGGGAVFNVRLPLREPA